MKNCLKWLVGMYTMLLLIVASSIFLACNNEADNYYTFDTSVYDETPNLSTDSIKNLFKRGITVKRFEGKDYFIANYIGFNENLNGNIIEFGPITVDDYNNYYDIKVKELNNDLVSIDITIKLISNFNKTIHSSVFKPSWVCWTSSRGFINVTHLSPITINYTNGVNENDFIYLQLSWNTRKELVDNSNILLSVESLNYYKNNAFKEILTFNLTRFN